MPPLNDEVLKVQGEVFQDEIAKELEKDSDAFVSDSVSAEHTFSADETQKMFAFIVENAPIFRLFTENLTPEVRAIWDRYAKGDRAALSELESYYDLFRKELEDFIFRTDPDAMTALAQAIEEGNVELATTILEANAHLRKQEEN